MERFHCSQQLFWVLRWLSCNVKQQPKPRAAACRMNPGCLINEQTNTKALTDLDAHSRTWNLGQSSWVTRGSELKVFNTWSHYYGERSAVIFEPNCNRNGQLVEVWCVSLGAIKARFKTSAFAKPNACGAQAWGGIPMRWAETSQTQQRIIIAQLTP